MHSRVHDVLFHGTWYPVQQTLRLVQQTRTVSIEHGAMFIKQGTVSIEHGAMFIKQGTVSIGHGVHLHVY